MGSKNTEVGRALEPLRLELRRHVAKSSVHLSGLVWNVKRYDTAGAIPSGKVGIVGALPASTFNIRDTADNPIALLEDTVLLVSRNQVMEAGTAFTLSAAGDQVILTGWTHTTGGIYIHVAQLRPT